jgi:hypothetical protein
MGLIKRLTGRPSTSASSDEPAEGQMTSAERKRSSINMVPLSEVTAASLQVWKQLPASIRHDPSMISFQQENERWKGENETFKLINFMLSHSNRLFIAISMAHK